MVKYLLLFGIALLVIWYVRRSSGQQPKREAPPPDSGDEMVRCVYCHVHLPRAEAIVTSGEAFCCEEHRRLSERSVK